MPPAGQGHPIRFLRSIGSPYLSAPAHAGAWEDGRNWDPVVVGYPCMCGLQSDKHRGHEVVSCRRRPTARRPGHASRESPSMANRMQGSSRCLRSTKSCRQQLMINSWLEEVHYEERARRWGGSVVVPHADMPSCISFPTTTMATLRPQQLPRPACGRKVVQRDRA